MNFLGRFTHPVYCLMRLLVGLMFACHGLDHVFGKFGGQAAPAGSFIAIGGWIEMVTGFLIAIGLLTRVAAFFASGAMAVAYFQMHAPKSLLPILNHGDPAVLYCWIFFFMIFFGPGRLSLDALLWRKKAEATNSEFQ